MWKMSPRPAQRVVNDKKKLPETEGCTFQKIPGSNVITSLCLQAPPQFILKRRKERDLKFSSQFPENICTESPKERQKMSCICEVYSSGWSLMHSSEKNLRKKVCGTCKHRCWPLTFWQQGRVPNCIWVHLCYSLPTHFKISSWPKDVLRQSGCRKPRGRAQGAPPSSHPSSCYSLPAIPGDYHTNTSRTALVPSSQWSPCIHNIYLQIKFYLQHS